MANRRAGVLLFVVMAGVGASPAAQLQPGYVGSPARPAGGAQGHRRRQPEVRDDLRHRLCRHGRPAAANDRNVDWPRGEPLANYTRTMNWDARTMKEEFDRKPGLNPASWKYGVGWMDGTPLQQHPRQIFVVNGKHALAHRRTRAARRWPSPPDDAERWQLDLWMNPHGFLKAAMMPGANPKAVWRWELGEIGPRRHRRLAGESDRRLDHGAGQVPGRRDDQQGEHAAADPHLGARSGARRHELRARVHQRQLRRSRQRHSVSRPAGTHHDGWDDNFRPRTSPPATTALAARSRTSRRTRAPTRWPFPKPSGRRRSRSASRRRSSPTACICWAARRTTAWPSSSRITSPSSKRRSTSSATSR